MGKYFTRQTRVYYYWLTRMYIVLFTHKNVAETTTIMPVFTYTLEWVYAFIERESQDANTHYINAQI